MKPRHKCRLMKHLFKQMFSAKPGEKLAKVRFETSEGVIEFTPSPFPFSPRKYSGVLHNRNLILVEVTTVGFSQDALLRKWGFECAWLWEDYDDFKKRRRLCFVIRDDEGRIGVYSEAYGDPVGRAYIELKSKISENRDRVMRWPVKS